MLALGAVPRTFPVPGLAEHGLGFKDLADAILLRNRILRELEAADAALDPEQAAPHLGFVFVGAGYAGVEALAELADLVRDALRWYPRLRSLPQRWVLVDAAPKILPEIPTRLGDYAAKELARRGVEIHVSTTLDSFDGDRAELSNGERIPARTLVWTAGVKASPLLGAFGMPLDDREPSPRRRVPARRGPRARLVARRLRRGSERARRPGSSTRRRASTRSARHAGWRRTCRASREPYGYRMLGQVATLGRYKGIADVMGMRLRGFPGWFVTRSYHLLQLPLFSRKLRVVVDWTTSLFFRRDIAELSGLGDPRRLGD